MPAPSGAPTDSTRQDSSAAREFTLRGIVLGLVLAIILGAANAYLGLYAGLTVSASIPAAVISMALLRGLGGATILENNFVQTIASAGEAVAAGAIFTLPALVVLGWRAEDLSYWQITLLCAVGGTLGSLLVVMLRRVYVVEERLPFPEGVACAEVLRAGDRETAALVPLIAGGLLAAALKTLQDIAGVLPGAVAGARWIGGIAVGWSCDLSAALLGVGYIIGLPIASVVLAGGVIAWFVAIPALSLSHPEMRHLPAAAAAAALWSRQVRFLGVGAMLTGGLATLWRMRAPIFRAVARVRGAEFGGHGAAPDRRELDIPPGVIAGATALCLPILAILYYRVAGSWSLAIALALALGVIGFFACAVSGYLTGLVGASNNPVSGVTLIILLTVALLLKVLGVNALVGPTLAILVGAVMAVAAAMAGDSLHDLATGFHVGATPRALEYGLLIGALGSALVVAPVLKLLVGAYGIAGTPHASAGALAAPQAFLMAQVVHGVFMGGLPWGIVAIGAGLALVLHLIDGSLERGGSRWRTPPMPLAIGLYLPLGLSVAIALGAVLGALADRGGDSRRGVLLAAGLVAGEALTGVLSATLVTLGVHLPWF